MKLRLKSLLFLEGLAFPSAPAGSQWSFQVRAQLRTLPCSGIVERGQWKAVKLLGSQYNLNAGASRRNLTVRINVYVTKKAT